MEILARLNHEKFDHTRDNVAHLVVSLKAPTLDWVKKRPALCVLPLVDLSGSMGGDKLEYAKKSLLKLIDHLQDGDVSGLVAFESRVHVLVPPAEVTPDFKAKLRKAVEQMQVMGGTNFSDGLLKAIEVIHRLDLSSKYLKRVIMFTDGEPTEGIQDHAQILRMMDSQRGSVTVSAFGYGNERGGITSGCDLGFLTKLSDEGKGNFAYVKNPDDALSAFAKELGGLLSTYATDLEIEIEPVNGHHITKVVTNIEHEEDGVGAYSLAVPDILSEETRPFVFEVKLAAQNKAFPRQSSVFDVKVSYRVLLEDGRRETRTAAAKARAQFVRAADADKTPIREVEEVVSLHRMIRAQLEAEELAKQGQYAKAAGLMKDLGQELTTNGYVQIAAAATAVGDRLSTSVNYSSSQGFLRSMTYAGTRGYGASGLDADASLLLTDCNVALNNSVMESVTNSFVAPIPTTIAPTPAPGEAPSTVASLADLLSPSGSNVNLADLFSSSSINLSSATVDAEDAIRNLWNSDPNVKSST